MTLEELKEPLKDVRLKHERRIFVYNPIKYVRHPDSERSFLREESCDSNAIGTNNDTILGMFCYDAK